MTKWERIAHDIRVRWELWNRDAKAWIEKKMFKPHLNRLVKGKITEPNEWCGCYKLWVYADPRVMSDDHEFADDVAICFARTKMNAYSFFKRYYGDATLDKIWLLEPRPEEVHILTSY